MSCWTVCLLRITRIRRRLCCGARGWWWSCGRLFDELLAGQVPPKPPLVLKYVDADDVESDEDAVTFDELLTACLDAQKAEAEAIRNVSVSKSALRTLERW
jgi:hypothetical protein